MNIYDLYDNIKIENNDNISVSVTEEVEQDEAKETEDRNKKNKSKLLKANDGFRIKECKIISRDKRNRALTVRIDNINVRFTDVNVSDYDNTETVPVKVKGIMGTSNFKCKL